MQVIKVDYKAQCIDSTTHLLMVDRLFPRLCCQVLAPEGSSVLLILKRMIWTRSV